MRSREVFYWKRWVVYILFRWIVRCLNWFVFMYFVLNRSNFFCWCFELYHVCRWDLLCDFRVHRLRCWNVYCVDNNPWLVNSFLRWLLSRNLQFALWADNRHR